MDKQMWDIEGLEPEDLLNAVLGSMRMSGVLLHDAAGTILGFWGNEAAKRYGIPIDEFRGKTLRDMLPAECAEARIATITEVARTGEEALETFEVEFPAGRFTFEAASSRIMSDGGPRVVVCLRDITELQQSQAELREVAEKYETIVEGMDHPIYVLKPDGEIEFINTEGAQRLGLTQNEMIGKSIWDYFPEDAVREIKRDIATVTEEDRPAEWERQTPVAGVMCWFHTRLIPLHDEEGKVVRVLGISMDITKRKEAEEAIGLREETEHAFRKQLEALHDVSIELTKAESVRELFRMAVELGRSRLGFDRLAFWLAGDDVNMFTGTCGTDEQGNTIEEWDMTRVAPQDRLIMELVSNQLPLAIVKRGSRGDGYLQRINASMQALAPLRDAEKIIGFASADNLLTDNPITPQDGEVLKLLASAVGHLYKRKLAEQQLQSKNVALHELLEAVEIKKAELGRNVQANVDSTVVPLLNDLWAKIDSSARPHLDAVLKALGDITSPFASKLSGKCSNLSPAEMRIAHLIASGMATKDIARYQHTAPATVSKQRESIRRKLELTGKKISLSSYLKSLLGDSPVR